MILQETLVHHTENTSGMFKISRYASGSATANTAVMVNEQYIVKPEMKGTLYKSIHVLYIHSTKI